MQLTRRKLFGFAAAAAASLLVPELVVSTKSIFLPPKDGWLRMPYASLVIPADHAKDFYAAEIASGVATYDINTEMMSWWRSPVAQAPLAEWANEPFTPALHESGAYKPSVSEDVRVITYRGTIQEREISAMKEAQVWRHFKDEADGEDLRRWLERRV